MDVWNNLYLVLFHFVNARIKEFSVICFCNNKWSSHTRIYSDGGRRKNYSIDYRKKLLWPYMCFVRAEGILYLKTSYRNFYLNLSKTRVTFSMYNGKIVTPIKLSIVVKKVPNWLKFLKLIIIWICKFHFELAPFKVSNLSH